ncbi:hypothetical protein FQN54_005402 [Arachnomyces sp. PD_36]|nr:hypothetical protein FQN54_005402 [Arachnomyces sp. PD_36]
MDISHNRNPHTPRSGKELMRTIDSLNNKFFLDLPNPAYSSPASRLSQINGGTDNGQSPLGVQCASLIKYLFFNAGPKLERLIIEFEEWAQPRIPQWTFKENQEPGTLPTRPTFIRRDVPAGSGIIPEGRQELLKQLEKLLRDEHYLSKAAKPSVTERVIDSASRGSNGRTYDALRGDTTTSTYSTGPLFNGARNNGIEQSHYVNQQHPTGPPPANEAANIPRSNKRRSTEENEVFTTAPNSPNSTTSPIPDELLGELLDEFEDFDLDDFDLDSVTKADVDVGDQKPKSPKKRQSRIDSFWKNSSSKTTETIEQVNKSSIGENEGISFLSMAPPAIFSRNQSTLGVSFGSENTDATEPIEHLDDNDVSSTQSSSMRGIWDDEEFKTSFNAACVGAGRPTASSRTSTREDPIVAELARSGPFSSKTNLRRIPLRCRYEIERTASLWNLQAEKISEGNRESWSTHAGFWEWVKGHSLRGDNLLPEKSSLRAWNQAVNHYQDTGKNCDAVILSGEFQWCEKSEPGYLKLNLKPMKLERSCRFYRRFGSDRFLAITIPYASSAPKHLVPSSGSLQDSIAKWLVTTDHHCLGRVWRAFYLEEVKVKAVKKDNDNDKDKEKREMRMKVHLFAVDGVDFVGTSPRDPELPPKDQLSEKRTPMSLLALMNWHMPFEANIGQTDCKLFQRFSLGLSKTIPSVALQTNEIFRLEDPLGKLL